MTEPLLRLFIPIPNGNGETTEIVIWNGDANEIETVISKCCEEHPEIRSYEHEIHKAVLELFEK